MVNAKNIYFCIFRFLKPSQVRGNDTEQFIRQQQVANNLYEQSILGYRGLVGKFYNTNVILYI